MSRAPEKSDQTPPPLRTGPVTLDGKAILASLTPRSNFQNPLDFSRQGKSISPVPLGVHSTTLSQIMDSLQDHQLPRPSGVTVRSVQERNPQAEFSFTDPADAQPFLAILDVMAQSLGPSQFEKPDDAQRIIDAILNDKARRASKSRPATPAEESE